MRTTRLEKEGPPGPLPVEVLHHRPIAARRAAIANLRRLCKEELAERYEIEIIDVLEHPQLAEDERNLATPTLIKQLPPPLRRVIGDLSNRDKVLLGLDVRPRSERPQGGGRAVRMRA